MTLTREVRSMGGLAKSKAIREAYEPKLCSYCNNPIDPVPGVPLGLTRAKKFCNRSCAASYNGARYPKRIPKPKAPDRVFGEAMKIITKEELFENSGTWARARASIQSNARKVWRWDGRLFACSVCSYANHAEICHIRAVSDFEGSATIGEINALNNLVALCPNHHWELDHGRLKL